MIGVIGTGAWGTTLAVVLARHGYHVTLYARSATEAQLLRDDGENRRSLPEIALPPSLRLGFFDDASLADCETLLLAVPSQRMRENIGRIRRYVAADTLVISAAKGLEKNSALRMSEVVCAELGPEVEDRLGVLSGPNLSYEVVNGLPTATVIASKNPLVSRKLMETVRIPSLRLYSNTDVVGVELSGAMKNIVAIGAGACDGLGYGSNAKAAFFTRGMAEIARLGTAMGANPLTFSGLAGIGDLVATCTSPLSRNRQLGELIGRGLSLAEALSRLNHVAEGVDSTGPVRLLAQRCGVDMPITNTVHAVLFEGVSPKRGVDELMARDQKGEFAGLDSVR